VACTTSKPGSTPVVATASSGVNSSSSAVSEDGHNTVV